MPSNLETDIRAAANAGFQALELWAAKIDRYLLAHTLDDLRGLLEHSGVGAMSINSLEFITFRGDEVPQVRSRCDELCRIARAIDCPTVVVVPSPTPSRETTWAEIVRETAGVLRDLGTIAAGHGTRLSFELLGFGWCSVRTLRGAWQIVQETGLDNVGLVVDCAHFYGGGGLLDEFEALDPTRIFTFHLDDLEDVPKEAITDAKRLLPGTGVIPLDQICRRLSRLGYDGDCSVELFRPEYWDWDPDELAVAVRAAALETLSPYFAVE
jgi:2-keto-myo-inositol isomerase